MFRFTKHPPEAKKDYKHEARGLVNGAFMREGTDYDKSPAATATGATIMLIIAVATACKMLLENFDIASAYTYSPIEENVYEEPFQGMNLDPSKCFFCLGRCKGSRKRQERGKRFLRRGFSLSGW